MSLFGSQRVHKPEHEFWAMIEGGKVQGSRGRVALAAGAIHKGTTAQMFSLPPGMEAPMQDLFMLTLVPPLVPGPVGGTAGPFYGYQVKPILNVFALVRHGTQTAPITTEVDFERGLSFPIYGPYISVEAVNESAFVFDNTNGPSCFISKGAFSSGIPRRTQQGLQGGAPITVAVPLAAASSTDVEFVPAGAQTLYVLLSPSFDSLGPPIVPGMVDVQFFDFAGAPCGDVLVEGTAENPIVVPADAFTYKATNVNQAAAITALRFVFLNSP
jgi:hypothetical protein